MEQKFVLENPPQAEIRVEGRRLIRGDVVNDWGLQLVWEIRRDGKVVATANARSQPAYEHADAEPGDYEAVLRMFHYIDYKKDKDGNYTKSKFIDVSNKVTYKV